MVPSLQVCDAERHRAAAPGLAGRKCTIFHPTRKRIGALFDRLFFFALLFCLSATVLSPCDLTRLIPLTSFWFEHFLFPRVFSWLSNPLEVWFRCSKGKTYHRSLRPRHPIIMASCTATTWPETRAGPCPDLPTDALPRHGHRQLHIRLPVRPTANLFPITHHTPALVHPPLAALSPPLPAATPFPPLPPAPSPALHLSPPPPPPRNPNLPRPFDPSTQSQHQPSSTLATITTTPPASRGTTCPRS